MPTNLPEYEKDPGFKRTSGGTPYIVLDPKGIDVSNKRRMGKLASRVERAYKKAFNVKAEVTEMSLCLSPYRDEVIMVMLEEEDRAEYVQ